MQNFPIPRLDENLELRNALQKYCRLQKGQIWEDPLGFHRVGYMDASDAEDVARLLDGKKAVLAIHDPPYNLVAFERRSIEEYISWCKRWIETTNNHLAENASLYVWLGADQREGFQP